MKSIAFTLSFFLLLSTASAQSVKALFDAEKLVFYGLDFSKAKFALPDAKPNEIKDRYFEEWHQGVMTDNARFNKESAFQKLSVYGDPFVAKKRNAAVNVADLVAKDDNPLSAKDIESVIAEYKDGVKKEGFGAVLIVESFNKKKEEGIAHVVLFDIATRKVLLDKRMVGKPGGGGLTNFWLRSIQNIFERMTATEFSIWKKEALGK
ncbi:MAG: hypothetical protein IPN22_04795 [Bacteroidetes bacterium]|nr:hypothetical protein [Bacteroidota bacterium]